MGAAAMRGSRKATGENPVNPQLLGTESVRDTSAVAGVSADHSGMQLAGVSEAIASDVVASPASVARANYSRAEDFPSLTLSYARTLQVPAADEYAAWDTQALERRDEELLRQGLEASLGLTSSVPLAPAPGASEREVQFLLSALGEQAESGHALEVRNVLAACDGDVDAALEYLLRGRDQRAASGTSLAQPTPLPVKPPPGQQATTLGFPPGVSVFPEWNAAASHRSSGGGGTALGGSSGKDVAPANSPKLDNFDEHLLRLSAEYSTARTRQLQEEEAYREKLAQEEAELEAEAFKRRAESESWEARGEKQDSEIRRLGREGEERQMQMQVQEQEREHLEEEVQRLRARITRLEDGREEKDVAVTQEPRQVAALKTRVAEREATIRALKERKQEAVRKLHVTAKKERLEAVAGLQQTNVQLEGRLQQATNQVIRLSEQEENVRGEWRRLEELQLQMALEQSQQRSNGAAAGGSPRHQEPLAALSSSKQHQPPLQDELEEQMARCRAMQHELEASRIQAEQMRRAAPPAEEEPRSQQQEERRLQEQAVLEAKLLQQKTEAEAEAEQALRHMQQLQAEV
eukprot:gene1142-1711_t